MTPRQIAAVVEGLIPLFGGATASLYAFQVLGKRPGADPKWDAWYRKYGSLLKVCGPLLILFGLWTMASPFLIPAATETPVQSLRTFPTQVGATWIYETKAGDITVRIPSHEKIGDVLCARLEMSLNGKVLQVDHVRPDQGILCKHASSGAIYSPAMPILKDLVLSASWEYRSENGAMSVQYEQKDGGALKTPMKPFESTVLVTLRGTDKNGEKTVQSWYAPGIGLVRELSKSKSGEFLLEIKSFSPP